MWRTVVSLTLFLFGDDDADVYGDDDGDGNGHDDDLYIYDADHVCLLVTKNDHFAKKSVCLSVSRKMITLQT